MTEERDVPPDECSFCLREATHVYQMALYPGPEGRIPVCDVHVEPFRPFAGVITPLQVGA